MAAKRQSDPFLNALRRLLCVCLILAILGGIGYLFYQWIEGSETFRVKGFKVTGNEFLNKDDVLGLAGLKAQTMIWEISLEEAEEKIETHPLVSRVCVVAYPPDGLSIYVEEKEPLALLNIDGLLYCVDMEGMVLPSRPGKLYDLPVLTGDFKGGVRVGSPARNTHIEEGLHFLKQVLEDRPTLFARISEVVLGRSDGLILHTHQDGLPVWIGRGEYRLKMRYLEAVLDELEGKDTRNIAYIDVRFRGQIFVGMRA